MDRMTDPDVTKSFLGTLEGIEVHLTDGKPLVALHGDEQSAVAIVDDEAFVNGFARLGVEIEVLLKELEEQETQEENQ